MADKPKRPMSAYFLWLNENREKIKKQNPDARVTEIAKLGGEMWRGMKDKTEWEAKAVQAKKDYEKAMAEYNKSGGGGNEKAAGKKRPKKDSKKPAKKGKAASEDDDEDESE